MPIRGLLALAAALAASCATLPGPEASRPLRVVVVSDLNGGYGSTAYAPEVAHVVARITGEWRPDLVLAAGDLIAGQKPSLPDAQVRAMWSAFDTTVAAPLRRSGIPLLATLGNHDASAYPAHARDRALAAEYWRDPAHRPALPLLDGASFPYRYTARVGDLFVAVWDATSQESSRADSLRLWLRDALGTPAARSARHRIVLGHLPIHAVAIGRDRPGEVLADADAFRADLRAWGATLYLSGHHHAYYPARRDSLAMLHAGALGDGPRPLLAGSLPPAKTVTLLELDGPSISATTFRVAPDGSLSPLATAELPPLLCGHNGHLVRWDLVAADTTCPARVN